MVNAWGSATGMVSPCVSIVVASSDLSSKDRGAVSEHSMTRYSEEFRASVVQKMMPPNNVPIAQLARRDLALTEGQHCTLGGKRQERKECLCLVMV